MSTDAWWENVWCVYCVFRQYAESSVRAHRKHMTSMHSTLKDVLDKEQTTERSPSSSAQSAAQTELSLQRGLHNTLRFLHTIQIQPCPRCLTVTLKRQSHSSVFHENCFSEMRNVWRNWWTEVAGIVTFAELASVWCNSTQETCWLV